VMPEEMKQAAAAAGGGGQAAGAHVPNIFVFVMVTVQACMPAASVDVAVVAQRLFPHKCVMAWVKLDCWGPWSRWRVRSTAATDVETILVCIRSA
jgi:hypothetical protein